MDDVEASVATVPSRTGDVPPVRPPVAMPTSTKPSPSEAQLQYAAADKTLGGGTGLSTK